VIVERDEEQLEFTADIVACSAGAIDSAALLLLFGLGKFERHGWTELHVP